MMAADLATARETWLSETQDARQRAEREQSDFLLAYCDSEGRTLDFHATRHTFITFLARSGVHPKGSEPRSP